jgi:hypothetical protein
MDVDGISQHRGIVGTAGIGQRFDGWPAPAVDADDPTLLPIEGDTDPARKPLHAPLEPRLTREDLNKGHNRHGVQKARQMCCVVK